MIFGTTINNHPGPGEYDPNFEAALFTSPEFGMSLGGRHDPVYS